LVNIILDYVSGIQIYTGSHYFLFFTLEDFKNGTPSPPGLTVREKTRKNRFSLPISIIFSKLK
jgi:hypothetical protein